jgi:hypothetical protein
MTKDEALKLSLEALQNPWKAGPDGVADAIIAIKEALAQPEAFSKQNYLNGYCVGQSDLLADQAKQEPAAWMVYTQDGKAVYMTDNPTDIESNQRALPLYVTPQRTWVGLTKEERHEISMANRPYCADVMAAHEEELKRRNT